MRIEELDQRSLKFKDYQKAKREMELAETH
jgi:hypothetical protein